MEEELKNKIINHTIQDLKRDTENLSIEEREELQNTLLKEMSKMLESKTLSYRGLPLDILNEMKAREFTLHQVDKLEKELKDFKNPTPEDKYKYTENYFKDNIAYTELEISKYKKLLDNEVALNDNFNKIKARTKELELEINNLMLERGLQIEGIEKLNSITPTKYIMANNKMVNKYASGEIKEGLTDLIVSSPLKKEVITPIALNYDDNNIEIYDKDKRFTPYDRSVHNSICSIYEAGNVNFTPNQVYRCMNGLSEGEYVSPQAIGSITRSIDKTRRIYTKVNYTDEARAWKKDIDNCIIEDHILSAKKITLEAGGKEVIGYKLNSKPILYEYAQVTGQVLTIPSELLNTKSFLNSTPEVTIIREYLIREIEWMKKKGSSRNNKIAFSGVYKEIEELDPTKQKAERIRKNISKLLDSFKEDKYIKSYKLYKEGRSFKGVEIFY